MKTALATMLCLVSLQTAALAAEKLESTSSSTTVDPYTGSASTDTTTLKSKAGCAKTKSVYSSSATRTVPAPIVRGTTRSVQVTTHD